MVPLDKGLQWVNVKLEWNYSGILSCITYGARGGRVLGSFLYTY